MIEYLKNQTAAFYLRFINAVLVLIGVVFSILCSSGAYKITQLNTVIAGAVIVIILDCIVMVLLGKIKNKIYIDLMRWVVILVICGMLGLMIINRITLMGYVYFSNLEANNPVAVEAMNRAVISWVFYGIALVVSIIDGFLKHKEN